MGAQDHFECGGFGKVLERPYDRGIRKGDLERAAMPSSLDKTPRISPLAGRPAPKEMLIDVHRLEREYFEYRPDLHDAGQRVSFGTSGHRGSPLKGSFTEAHV